MNTFTSYLVGLALAATSCEAPAPARPAVTPEQPAQAVGESVQGPAGEGVLGQWRYEPATRRWVEVESRQRMGLYWLVRAEGRERWRDSEFVGPVACNDISLAAPAPPGQIAVCVPRPRSGQATHVPDPSRLTRGLCFDCAVPLCVGHGGSAGCRGVAARVRAHVDTPLAREELAVIEASWRATLLALAQNDAPALEALSAGCSTGAVSMPAPAERLAPLAARWDEDALHLGRTQGDRIDASIGPITPAMTTVSLERRGDRWAVCAFHPGA